MVHRAMEQGVILGIIMGSFVSAVKVNWPLDGSLLQAVLLAMRSREVKNAWMLLPLLLKRLCLVAVAIMTHCTGTGTITIAMLFLQPSFCWLMVALWDVICFCQLIVAFLKIGAVAVAACCKYYCHCCCWTCQLIVASLESSLFFTCDTTLL